MHLSGLLDLLRDSATYRELLARLNNPSDSPDVMAVIRAARPFLLAAIARDWDGPVLYLTTDTRRAYNVAEQLPVWLGQDAPVYRFAEPTQQFYERVPWDKDIIRSRIETLHALLSDTGQSPIVIVSARALMQRTPPVSQFRHAAMTLQVGQRHILDKLLAAWVGAGYEPVSVVTEPGTFSRRGGILDIFPLAADMPVRVDFFDDEIDSLRQFDPSTQRSAGRIETAVIPPAREALPEHTPPLAAHLAAWFRTLPDDDEALSSSLSDGAVLETGMAFPYLEHYLPYLYANPISVLDYAPENALILVDDVADLRDFVNDIAEHADSLRDDKLAANTLPPDYPAPFLEWSHLQGALDTHKTLHLSTSIDDEANAKRLFVPGGRFGGQLRPLLTHLRGLNQKGDRVVVITQQTARLTELWYEQDSSAFIPSIHNLPEPPPPGGLTFVSGALHEGWSLRTESAETHIFTDAEIFGWSRPEPRRRKVQARSGKAPDAGYAEWQSGDYVVHVDYGIGRFDGMQRRTIEGTEREYLLVEYAGTDKIFVPIHQADRLTRYVGADDKPPALHSLGKQGEWARITRRVKKDVEEEARELLAIYAKRASTKGFAFTPDSHWQHELEASFPYVETEDQMHAISNVKADMENTMPMDRLICGDVGYGKTEVALRAAFKAVMDGKQVAILVPTTVLAQQHYHTFASRLAPFPVNVEMMSRFRTKEQQNRILAQIAHAQVDIIVGTHRLLSNDVTFKNLGLVIIDEEQRFGVKHKEHFKRLRAQVDVLTLTATPIPRTLYMSLTGVRDISMIHTPPEERLPIITHVGLMDEQLVRQAILREMDRGGQVFFVHNRVRTIESIKEWLGRIVPEARTVVAHGQMSPRYLEQVMDAFARDEYDVLISTSIIENGIDMPTVNTLIVDRADWFGMAQLYQLRGRVGRGAQQAYAYLFHSGAGKLTEEARVRLDAMAEHSDLGAGFQIAMRDLELRGAGDILSTNQTGHVAAIGLHLYTQLLTEAVQKIKGKQKGEITPAAATERIIIDLPLPAYIPNDWIPELALRLQIYRRIAVLTSTEEVEKMRDELRDRFGALPLAVEGLLYQMDVKLLAQHANATAVIKQQDTIQIKLPYLPNIDRPQLEATLGRNVTVTRTAVALDAVDETWMLRLLDVLRQLAEGVGELGVGV